MGGIRSAHSLNTLKVEDPLKKQAVAIYTVKKVIFFPIPGWDVTNPNYPWLRVTSRSRLGMGKKITFLQ